MDDSINRQDAINIVCFECGEWKGLAKTIMKDINNLPSAQPDITHCQDCKYWMPYDWMFSEVWRSISMDDYSEDEIGCFYCDRNMGANDFCSKAERREE